jgi:hypothetical protein
VETLGIDWADWCRRGYQISFDSAKEKNKGRQRKFVSSNFEARKDSDDHSPEIVAEVSEESKRAQHTTCK